MATPSQAVTDLTEQEPVENQEPVEEQEPVQEPVENQEPVEEPVEEQEPVQEPLQEPKKEKRPLAMKARGAAAHKIAVRQGKYAGKEDDVMSASEAFWKSMEVDTASMWIAKRVSGLHVSGGGLSGPDFEEDQNFRWLKTDEEKTEGLQPNSELYFDEFIADVPKHHRDNEDFVDDLLDARSWTHAEHIKQMFIERAKVEDEFAKMGMPGFFIRLGASILDPVTWLAVIGTSIFGGSVKAIQIGKAFKTAQGSARIAGQGLRGINNVRLGNFIRGGLVTGVESAAVSGYIASEDPMFDYQTAAWATLGASVLGGTIRSLYRVPTQLEIDSAIKGRNAIARLDRDFIDEIDELELTPEGKKALPKITQEEIDELTIPKVEFDEAAERVARHGRHLDDEVDDSTILRELEEYAEDLPEFKDAHQKLADAIEDTPIPGMASLRQFPSWMPLVGGKKFDIRAALGLSENRLSRWLGLKMAGDTLAPVDPVTGKAVAAPMSASEEVLREIDIVKNDLSNTIRSTFRAWLKDENAGWWARNNPITRERYMSDVADAVKGAYTGTSKQVKTAAAKVKKVLKQNQELLIREGLLDPEDVIKGNYFPRKWDIKKITQAVSAFDESTVLDLLALSARQANKKLSQPESETIAKALLKNIKLRHELADYNSSGLWMKDSRTMKQLDRMLRDQDLDEDVIEIIKSKLRPKKKKGGLHKPRLHLDETVSVKDADGNVLRFSDLVDNNAERVVLGTLRSTSGNVHMNKVLRELDELRGKKPGTTSWGDVVGAPGRQGILHEMGERYGQNSDEIADMLHTLKTLHDGIIGRSPWMESARGRKVLDILKVLRMMNYTTRAGQFGIASMAELGQPTAAAGLRAMWNSMPMWRKMLKTAWRGEVPEGDFLAELLAMTGASSDRLFREVGARLDDAGRITEAGLFGRLNQLSNATSMASGLTFIDSMERQMALQSIAFRFIHFAKTGRGAPFKGIRLRQIGLDEDSWERVAEQLRRHGSEIDTGWSNVGIPEYSFNLDSWTDKEAGELLANALFKHTHKTIHRTQIGQLAPWMNHPVGRLITEWKTFMIGSYNSQFLGHLQARDARAASLALMNLTFAGLAYYTRTMVRYGNDKKKLEEYLSLPEMIKGTIYSSGFATYLPPIIDSIQGTGLTPMEEPMWGSNIRSSGLGMDVITGTPTAGTLSSISRGSQALGHAMPWTEGKFSERDLHNIRKLIPLNNTLAFNNALNLLEDYVSDELNLPETSSGGGGGRPR